MKDTKNRTLINWVRFMIMIALILGSSVYNNLTLAQFVYSSEISYASADTFRYPLNTSWYIGLGFGEYNSRFPSGRHLGIDLMVPAETQVFAVANGKVMHNQPHTDYMNVVVIEHRLPDGTLLTSVYGHMKPGGIAEGIEVQKGQFIGTIDTAASFANHHYTPHLHFGIRKGAYSSTWVYYGYEYGGETLSNWYSPTEFIDSHADFSPVCPSPSNGLPRDERALNNNLVTFSWSPPSCTGLDYYTFRVANHADIDNQPWIIDHGVASNATSITETIPTSYNGQTLYWAIWPHNSAGYGSKGGPWSFKIDTSNPTPPEELPTGTWAVQYFNNKELTSQCNATSFDRTFIFQDWGDGAPASGCNSNQWSARFSRQISFAGGHYDFMLEADDWARIFVDGTLVVNKWDGASQHHEGFDISGGPHEVKIEFADTEGAAKVSAWWWGPGFNVPHDTQDTNQWFANYWINQTQWWDAFANVNEGTGILNHDWGYDNPGWDMPSDNFSAKYRRNQYFECGTYRFIISHDDGAKFWLDDVLKVDRWSGAIGYYEFIIPVTRGTHLLQVDMYEDGGAANIYFNWEQIGYCYPAAPSLQYPGNGVSLAWNTDLTLQWNAVPDATQYLVQLSGGPNVEISSGWISSNQWHLGGLWPGNYTWSVTARNDSGSSSPSSAWTFTIQEPPPSPPQSQNLYLPAIFRGAQGQWNTILYEGFEGVFPGNWNTLDSSGLGYQWKDRSCLSSVGSWSGWAMGGGTNGLTLPCGSTYINDANTWLYIGPFNLSDATKVELKFDLWLNTEMQYDFLHWGASTDGFSYNMVEESGSTNGWVSRSLDLSNVNGQNFVGQSQVWIGFLFTSDYSINYPTGAAIDEVVLRKCVGGVCQ